MNENMNINSSQESLPLSQETYSTLLNVMGFTLNEVLPVTSAQDWENIRLPSETSTVECLGEMSDFISKHQTRPQDMNTLGGPLPAVTNWPGDYDFNVFFESQESISKKAAWVFSESSNKLYVKKNCTCPINFSTSVPMGEGFFIRAMAVFTELKDANEIVCQCINHSIQDLSQNPNEAQHLIRCGSGQSYYAVDACQRHSVCVPYENPPVGQAFSTYLYKFTCFTSCAGGANRRPTTLVFTLENGYKVIGRQCFGLKVCACPNRDKTSDETTKVPITRTDAEQMLEYSPNPKKTKLSSDNSQVASQMKKIMDIQAPASKPEKKKEFYVKATDEGMFKFLTQMKKFYCMQQNVTEYMSRINASSVMRSKLYLIRSSSDEDEEKT